MQRSRFKSARDLMYVGHTTSQCADLRKNDVCANQKKKRRHVARAERQRHGLRRRAAIYGHRLCRNIWSRGVTVSILDPESSDRGSNPRETFLAQRSWHASPKSDVGWSSLQHTLPCVWRHNMPVCVASRVVQHGGKWMCTNAT